MSNIVSPSRLDTPASLSGKLCTIVLGMLASFECKLL